MYDHLHFASYSNVLSECNYENKGQQGCRRLLQVYARELLSPTTPTTQLVYLVKCTAPTLSTFVFLHIIGTQPQTLHPPHILPLFPAMYPVARSTKRPFPKVRRIRQALRRLTSIFWTLFHFIYCTVGVAAEHFPFYYRSWASWKQKQLWDVCQPKQVFSKHNAFKNSRKFPCTAAVGKEREKM